MLGCAPEFDMPQVYEAPTSSSGSKHRAKGWFFGERSRVRASAPATARLVAAGAAEGDEGFVAP